MREKPDRDYEREYEEPKEGTRGFKAPKKITQDDTAECNAGVKNEYVDYIDQFYPKKGYAWDSEEYNIKKV